MAVKLSELGFISYLCGMNNNYLNILAGIVLPAQMSLQPLLHRAVMTAGGFRLRVPRLAAIGFMMLRAGAKGHIMQAGAKGLIMLQAEDIKTDDIKKLTIY